VNCPCVPGFFVLPSAERLIPILSFTPGSAHASRGPTKVDGQNVHALMCPGSDLLPTAGSTPPHWACHPERSEGSLQFVSVCEIK